MCVCVSVRERERERDAGLAHSVATQWSAQEILTRNRVETPGDRMSLNRALVQDYHEISGPIGGPLRQAGGILGPSACSSSQHRRTPELVL